MSGDTTIGLSVTLDQRSRKTLTLLLRGIANVGQTHIARQLGVSDTWVSRFKDQDLARVAILLTTVGYKITPLAAHCVPEDDYKFMLQATREKLERMKSAFTNGSEPDTGIHFD